MQVPQGSCTYYHYCILSVTCGVALASSLSRAVQTCKGYLLSRLPSTRGRASLLILQVFGLEIQPERLKPHGDSSGYPTARVRRRRAAQKMAFLPSNPPGKRKLSRATWRRSKGYVWASQATGRAAQRPCREKGTPVAGSRSLRRHHDREGTTPPQSRQSRQRRRPFPRRRRG